MSKDRGPHQTFLLVIIRTDLKTLGRSVVGGPVSVPGTYTLDETTPSLPSGDWVRRRTEGEGGKDGGGEVVELLV